MSNASALGSSAGRRSLAAGHKDAKVHKMMQAGWEVGESLSKADAEPCYDKLLTEARRGTGNQSARTAKVQGVLTAIKLGSGSCVHVQELLIDTERSCSILQDDVGLKHGREEDRGL
jgi:hypothetical protein